MKDKIFTSRPELHPVPVHTPWHHIGLDFVGPISPVSTQGNKYILTVSDYFSKWVCAFALPNKEAPGVAISLIKVIIIIIMKQNYYILYHPVVHDNGNSQTFDNRSRH